MATRGTFKLKAVWEALEKCAPGYSKKETQHHWVVYSPDKSIPPFRNLTLGRHGARRPGTVEVQRGQVKGLAKLFKVLKCMQRELPGL